MLRTQISLTEEERALLDAEAGRTGLSISALIRRAVDRTYGTASDASADIQVIEAAAGAWLDRDFDGATLRGEPSLGRADGVRKPRVTTVVDTSVIIDV